MTQGTVGFVIAIVVLVAAAVLGFEHQLPRDEALLFGALAVARLT